MNLKFVFKSSDHIRYENGKHVSGPHGGAGRAIKVEPNISDGEGYTVTLYNLDGNHPVWQNNVQMAPKQMKIIQQSNAKVELCGFGHDMMGASFADYGLTIHFTNGQVSKCILHLRDRGIDIEYLKDDKTDISANESEVISLSQRANAQYQNENVTDGRRLLIQIYQTIKSDPAQLKNIDDYSSIGTSFLLMLDQGLSDDIDTLQMMASVGYLCISKGIEKHNSNLNLYRDRLFLLRIGHKPLKYTVMTALDLNSSGIMSFSMGFSDLQARDEIYKMEIADLELHPQLYQQVPFFKKRKDEFDEMIDREFFKPEKSLDKVIKSGVSNHKKLLDYLIDKVIKKENVTF